VNPVGFGLGLGVAGAAGYLAPQALRIPAVRALRGAVRTHRALCLTYDDGPGPETTPLLLDRLAAAGGRASFFVVAGRVQAAPEVAARIVDEGHELGAHSAHHLHGWKVDPVRHARDNEAGFRALAPWSNGSPPLFRPTFGKLTAASWAVARRHRARVAWWTLDSGDTWAQLPSVQHVVEAVDADGGGVVLLHDLDRSASRREFVLEVTDRLLALAARKDLSVIGLGELMARADR
jgi:peptidoglycan/xylan/chitin deacetylase (PgdA/CDA1 family)